MIRKENYFNIQLNPGKPLNPSRKGLTKAKKIKQKIINPGLGISNNWDYIVEIKKNNISG